MIAVIGSLVFVPGCKRTDLADPDMHEPAGFIINLSGVANPGLLFVSQGGGWQNSYITMTALYNNGNPVVGKGIVMKINDEFGTFPGDKRTAVITTNSQGKASIRYSISQLAHDQIGADLLIYIQAWMQVDLYNVYDVIPLQLVTNMPDEEVNTFMAIQQGSSDDIDATTGGSFNVLLYNSTGTESINYIINIVDTNSIISSHSDGDTGSTGTTGNTETFEVTTGTVGWTATITITAITPADVTGTSFIITVNLI